jgi:hypothetical protein
MKKMTMIIAILLVASLSFGNIIQYPIADDVYAGSDTLHVTTTETKWALGSGDVRWIRIINASSVNLISIRIQQGDSVSTIGSYCGAYGTWLWPSENALLNGPAVDSLWIDADSSATIYVDWLEVK